jgi:hypothetical protein
MMEGHQLPWVTFSDAKVWSNLERDYAGICEVFLRLAGTMKKAFEHDETSDPRNLAVYSTGRLACEDLVEIAFLAEHGYGFAALKLLRGIYERTVVGRYIASDPEQAQRFYDYHIIDRHKFSERASSVYASDWPLMQDSESETTFEAMKKQFKYAPCVECGRSTQDSFSNHSLPALARKASVVGQIVLQDGTVKVTTMEDAYLLGAAIPNAHIHASMWSFLQHLKSDGDVLTWNSIQEYPAEFALSFAHANMLEAFESQNHFINLGLEEEIKDRGRDWHRIWKRGGSKPAQDQSANL